jgi:cation:H+ antiporter
MQELDGAMITRVYLNCLQRLVLFPARLPAWVPPTLVFVGALGVTLFAAAQYTRLLERLTAYGHFSLEMLGFLGALGANIPNYVAALAAFLGGHGLLGMGIVVGSNIYNVAVILALAALATPGRSGIVLGKLAAREVRHLAWLVAFMGGALLVLVLLGAALVPGYQDVQVLLIVVIIGLFVLVVRDALRAGPGTETEKASEKPPQWESEGEQTAVAAVREDDAPPLPVRTILLAMLALGITLFGVVVMVQAAEMSANQLQLSPIILSLVVLAVATSLPNTVVAYQLARREGGSTSVEEILSSNAINLALGVAVPLLLWPMRVPAGLLTDLDLPVLAALGLCVVTFVYTRRIPRWAGLGLFAVYAAWISLHLLL